MAFYVLALCFFKQKMRFQQCQKTISSLKQAIKRNTSRFMGSLALTACASKVQQQRPLSRFYWFYWCLPLGIFTLGFKCQTALPIKPDQHLTEFFCFRQVHTIGCILCSVFGFIGLNRLVLCAIGKHLAVFGIAKLKSRLHLRPFITLFYRPLEPSSDKHLF